MSRVIASLIATAAILTAVTTPASAVSLERFCSDYAAQAVRSAVINGDLNCGFRGGRFSNDYEQHFSWCLRSDPDSVDRERYARRRSIQQCQAQRRY